MYAHITWHTWRRVGCVDSLAATEVRRAAASVGKDSGVEVLRGAVLADHVHLVVSFRPDTRISDFVRRAKSIAALRANRKVPGAVKWARGYYVATIHRNDLPRVISYVSRQFERHPDLIPKGTPSPH
jgi:REP-associated tyrosine transposase